MATLRTPESERVYHDLVAAGILKNGCALCSVEPIQVFSHWKIVKNAYPYDQIANIHDMLVPLRHVREHELTQEELDELLEIKEEYVHPKYEYIIEATHRRKSIPAHFHLHLIIAKDEIA